MKAKNLIPLKKWCLLPALGILLLLSFAQPSAGQCGNTLGVRSYDTLLTGPGYGTYTISFPKWNPDSGTLLSVKLNALVSQQYHFTLQNADVLPSIYTLVVGRYDQISGAAMPSTYANTMQQTIGAYPLNPGAAVTRSNFATLQNYANTDSISSSVANFAGTGNLSFVYSPITYTDIQTNNNSSYSYGAAASDSVHFSISYLFCSASLLASSLVSFSALPTDGATVKLSWTMTNETGGRRYEVQQSGDGAHFTSVGSLPSVAGGTGTEDYSYDWSVPVASAASTAAMSPASGGQGGVQSGGQGEWYFRLKIDDANGGSTYSDIKLVTLGSRIGAGFRLYPDPATDFVNIIFDEAGPNAPAANGQTGGGGWQVELFSADGRLLQRERYAQARTARLDFRRPLARGTYFIRVRNEQTGNHYTAPFLIR